MSSTGNPTIIESAPVGQPNRRKVIAVALAGVAAVAILGVVGFQSAGRSAAGQATQLGDAIIGDPTLLYDQARIASTADSLGVRVAFPDGFEQTGAIEVKAWLPLANACLYLPSIAGWAYNIGDAPCDLTQPRPGPDQLEYSERVAMGIRQAFEWATVAKPLTVTAQTAAGDGFGWVYLLDEGSNGTNVSFAGQARVTSGTGSTHFEARADYTCTTPGCDTPDPASKVTRSGNSYTAEYTPATALLSVPKGATNLRLAVRQCVTETTGMTTCGDWITSQLLG